MSTVIYGTKYDDMRIINTKYFIYIIFKLDN